MILNQHQQAGLLLKRKKTRLLENHMSADTLITLNGLTKKITSHPYISDDVSKFYNQTERYEGVIQEIVTSRIAHQPELHLAGLVPTLPTPCAPSLLELRSALWSLSQKETFGPDVCTLVDLDFFNIRSSPLGRSVYSESMAKGFDILYRKEKVRVEDFARHCFDLIQFEPSSHLRRVFGLLSEMRKMASGGMVMPLRFERRTYALEGRCSIQLSYGTT